MKKIFIMLAMVQMMICSCMKPEIENTQIKEPAAGEVVFTAVIEQTKALPSAGGVVSWTENEEIGVYDGAKYVKATVLGIEGNKIKFSAKVDPTAASYMAINPYAAGKAGDGKTINFAAAQTTGKHVISIASFTSAQEASSFHNVGNLLRFKVNKTAVKKAKIVGNNAEKLAGNVTANAETGEATGTLTEAEIVTDITPGVDNFIALAPGVSLPDGFTITLYGDDECTDYQGEVASAGAIDFTGENARNQMRNLGVIDGWIDNYKLWQAGKPINIAGKQYSKESTGQSATLISAKDADFDLFDKLYNKTGVFFLETFDEFGFFSRSFINVGTATSNTNTFLISRYDNAPVTFKPTQNFSLISGNMYLKGIHIYSPSASGKNNFFTVSTSEFGNLHLDCCKIDMLLGKQFYYATGNQSHAIKSLKIVNSKIESLADSYIVFINLASSFVNRPEINEIEFSNNLIYSKKTTGYIKLLMDSYNPEDPSVIKTTFRILNNTFYNTHYSPWGQSDIQNYTMGTQIIKGNIYYTTESPTNASSLIYSQNKTNEYEYEISDNVTNHTKIFWFRSNAEGLHQNLGSFIPQSADLAFKTADTEKGIFIPIDKYASYGAKQ